MPKARCQSCSPLGAKANTRAGLCSLPPAAGASQDFLKKSFVAVSVTISNSRLDVYAKFVPDLLDKCPNVYYYSMGERVGLFFVPTYSQLNVADRVAPESWQPHQLQQLYFIEE